MKITGIQRRVKVTSSHLSILKNILNFAFEKEQPVYDISLVFISAGVPHASIPFKKTAILIALPIVPNPDSIGAWCSKATGSFPDDCKRHQNILVSNVFAISRYKPGILR